MTKKILLLGGLLLLGTLGMAQRMPGDIITLNLSQSLNPPTITYGSGGQWTQTYNDVDYTFIDFEHFSFSHLIGGESYGGTYWDGFTISINGDNTNYGQGSSAGWYVHPWGNMAGGGIKVDEFGNIMKDENGKVIAEQGIPYLLAYWSAWTDMGGDYSLQTILTDVDVPYQPVGVYVNLHPWPYYSNIEGDGFARPLNQNGDYLKLIIHGLNANYEDNGKSVEYYLAQNLGGTLIQSSNWEWIDLSSLGEVYGFYYTMTSSDSTPGYGPNTATYFCLDKLQFQLPNMPPSKPTGLHAEATATTISLTWNPSTDDGIVESYNIYLNGILKTSVSDIACLIENLIPTTSYTIEVEAVDNAGALSEKASITISTTEITSPSTPTNLTAIPEQTTIALSWTASISNVDIAGYNVYLDGMLNGTTEATIFTVRNLATSTEYLIEIEAFDVNGNKSDKASILVKTLDISGILNINKDSFKVYPNPFKLFIVIESSIDCKAVIYDVTGNQLSTVNIHAGNNIINTATLVKGIYLLKLNEKMIKIVK